MCFEIALPVRLKADMRKKILKAYDSAIDEVGDAEIKYINKKFKKVVQGLKRQDDRALAQLAMVAKALASLLKQCEKKRRFVKLQGRREIIAALYYLCDVFDIIPDYIPGEGYADDILVMNDCLKRLHAKEPQAYALLEDSIGKFK